MPTSYGGFFKILNIDGTTYHGGKGQWPLPNESMVGEWTKPIEGKLIWSKNGYHLCRAEDLSHWLGPAIFEAEYQGELKEKGNIVFVRQARLIKRLRWNSEVARYYICDLVEQVLPIYEKLAPGEQTPHQLLALAKRYLAGKASLDELHTAYQSVVKISYRDNSIWQVFKHSKEEILWFAGFSVMPLLEEQDTTNPENNINYQVRIAVETLLRIIGRAAAQVTSAEKRDDQAGIIAWREAAKAAYPKQVEKLLHYLYS
jgi:hypothetical protein